MNKSNTIINERKQIITQIIELYPRLKIQEDKILLKLEENDKLNINQELIFDTIIINNNKYYIDKNKIIYDNSMNIMGIQKNNDNILFENTNTKINSIIKDIKLILNIH